MYKSEKLDTYLKSGKIRSLQNRGNTYFIGLRLWYTRLAMFSGLKFSFGWLGSTIKSRPHSFQYTAPGKRKNMLLLFTV